MLPAVSKAALVVNSLSRTGARAYERAEAMLRELGLPLASSFPLQDPARLPETVAEAIQEQHDLVIVGGGDGTISSVVDQFADSEVPLGLLPLGTANDFARTLHVPTELAAACRTIVEGKLVDVDLGLAGHNYYANRASVGIGAEVAKAMSPLLKRFAGGMAYPVATVRALRRHQPFEAWLEFPDNDHPEQHYPSVLQISVANGRYFGGGQLAAADSGIDDATMDISVINHGSLRELVTVARNLHSGHLLYTNQASHFRTSNVRLSTRPELAINIDGELVAHTPQEFTVARNALHVIVPQSWQDAT